jgi:hypothetical protein
MTSIAAATATLCSGCRQWCRSQCTIARRSNRTPGRGMDVSAAPPLRWTSGQSGGSAQRVAGRRSKRVTEVGEADGDGLDVAGVGRGRGAAGGKMRTGRRRREEAARNALARPRLARCGPRGDPSPQRWVCLRGARLGEPKSQFLGRVACASCFLHLSSTLSFRRRDVGTTCNDVNPGIRASRRLGFVCKSRRGKRARTS